MKNLIFALLLFTYGSLFAQKITISVEGKTHTFTSFTSGDMSALPAGMSIPNMPKSQTTFRASEGEKSLQFMFDTAQLKGKKAPFSLKIATVQFMGENQKKVLQMMEENIFIKVSEYDEATQTFSGTLEGSMQNMTAGGFGGWKKNKAVVVFEKVKL
ncbi:MAG: hypothetical protein H7Y04_14380 [Verrucomicrobia bacterium]|nr:hypothetical protein [Cytophagales bacterium]